MVAAKVFILTIHLHVHNIYCRGAKPRPWGPIRLLALTKHTNSSTRALLPAFPLLVREDISFRQVVQCGSDLRSLEHFLKKEALKLQLVQGEGDILLAQLTTSLARVLFPRYPLKWLREGVEMELVLTPTSRFQSAVGPRVELSSRFLIEYCTDDKMKVLDAVPLNPTEPHCCAQFHRCSCLDHSQPDIWRPETTHSGIGPHQCQICDTYDNLVARRFSGSHIRPYSMKV